MPKGQLHRTLVLVASRISVDNRVDAPYGRSGSALLLDCRHNLRVNLSPLSIIVAALVVMSVASACRDGSSSPETPQVSPTASDGEVNDDEVSEVHTLLSRMVLTEEDLPAELQQGSVFYSTNEEVAGSGSLAEARLAELEGWGRLLGYDIEFVPSPDAPSDAVIKGMQNAVSLYASAEGASDSFADGMADARASDWAASYPDLAELEVEEVDRASLGDEAVWFRISGISGTGKLLVDDQVAIRVGPARSFLRVVMVFDGGMTRETYLDEVEAWAKLLVARIEAIIASAETLPTVAP